MAHNTSSRREALQKLGQDAAKFSQNIYAGTEEEEKELQDAEQTMEKIIELDEKDLKIDKKMEESLKDAMESFKDAMQHSEHIEKLINQADDPMDAMKMLQRDNKEIGQVEEDIQRAYEDLKGFKQELEQKRGDVSSEEDAEAKLEELFEHLEGHLEDLRYMDQALRDELGSTKGSQLE